MASLHLLVVRDDSAATLTPTMVNLLIAFLVLLIVAVLLVLGLVLLRHVRRPKQEPELPLYTERRISNHRRLTIRADGRTASSIYVYQEKQSLIDDSYSPPPSPVPEIRITFPEEVDEAGKRQSGKVVVVRLSDQGGVGLEPVQEDLPPYQQNPERFQSLDLERIGGLREKDIEARFS